MKKVSEFFDLPVGSDNGIVIDSEGCQCGEFNLMVEAKAAARAINSVDALADALEDVVKAWKFLCACNGYDEDHLVEFENAKKTLQAYRGTK